MAHPSQIQSAIDAFRLRVLAMEARSTSILTAAYRDVRTALEPEIAELTARILAAQAAGEAPSEGDLFRQQRYRELLDQIGDQIDRYSQTTKAVTTASQQVIVRASLIEAGQLLAPVSGGSGGALAQLIDGWVQLPDDAIVRLVGALQADTPLDAVLKSYAPDAVDQVAQTLIRGLALGQGADPLTREVESALNITRARAEVIVRSETMRASSAAMIAAYDQSGVTTGWRWVASLSDRTCSACLANHGKTFSLDTPMRRHANCRCAAAPVLGPEWDGEWESGEEWLKKQKLESQELVLGRQGAADFSAGNVRLIDFRKLTRDDVWGDSYVDGGIGHARRSATLDGRAPDDWAPAPERRKPKKAQVAA